MELQYIQKIHLLLNLVQENFYSLEKRNKSKKSSQDDMMRNIQEPIKVKFQLHKLIKLSIEISQDLIILNALNIHFIQNVEEEDLILEDKDILMNFFVTLFVYIFSQIERTRITVMFEQQEVYQDRPFQEYFLQIKIPLLFQKIFQCLQVAQHQGRTQDCLDKENPYFKHLERQINVMRSMKLIQMISVNKTMDKIGLNIILCMHKPRKFSLNTKEVKLYEWYLKNEIFRKMNTCEFIWQLKVGTRRKLYKK